MSYGYGGYGNIVGESEGAGISIDFGRIFGTLKKYFWVIILFLVAGIVGAIAYLNIATPIYQSFALLKVEQRVQDSSPLQFSRDEDLRSVEMMATIQRGFLTRSLMLQIIEKLDLVNRPEFLGADVPKDERTEGACLAELMENITTEVVRGTRFIMVKFDHPDPELATEITQAIVAEYIALDAEQRLQSAGDSISYLNDEVRTLKANLEKSEEDLSDYAEKLGSVSVDNELNIIASQLLELNSRLTVVKAERLKLEVDFEQIKEVRDDPEALLQIGSIGQLPEIQNLRAQLNDLDAQFTSLQQRYGEKSSQYLALKSQKDALQESLMAEALRAPRTIEIALRAAMQNEASLQRETDKQEKKTLALKRDRVESSVLERQIEVNRTTYMAALQRLSGEYSQARSQPFFLQVVDPASPAYQIAPNAVLVVAISVVLSFFLSAGVIFLITILDTTFKSVVEVEQMLELPVLTAIPESIEVIRHNRAGKKGKGTSEAFPIPLIDDKLSTVSEAIRTIRAALLLSNESNRKMLVTSAVPGEGKSFCSINLAVAFAQQEGRTVLIDGDLRKPVIESRLFDTSRHVGLSDYLMGRADIDEILRPSGILESLFVITAGRSYPNPSELLSRRERVVTLLAALEQRFEWLVMDSAPILAVSDTLSLAKHFDSISLVVASHRTPRALSRRAVDLLSRTGHPPTGVALNMVPARGMNAYQYYGHDDGGQAYGRKEESPTAA